MIENISMKDFLNLNENINIIDIRSIEKYNNNHIPNAKNIPFEKILTNPEEFLDKQKTYYIYCQKGITSYKVCQILKKQNYKVININGGYESWILKQN